ncbi:MAG: hypothetical protein Q9212_005902 [Teloschistes hypoglaucus]
MAAYAPLSQSAASLVPGTNPADLHRQSPTPPPLTKREKRKNAMAERLRDISTNFAENREYHYRRQLQALQRDLSFITHAEPYRDQPLEEILDDFGPDGGNDAQPRAGKWARKFIEEVNNAMEDRDAQLCLVVDRHNFRVRELKDDYEYFVGVAEKESTNLLSTLRTRLIQNVMQKKAALMKERDKFELADAASLLLNPNQFSFASSASPGGVQSNRKTRHTRHRLDVEDIGSTGETKRKRKFGADADEGSPAPAGRILEGEAPTSSKELPAKVDAYQSHAPAYSMGHLFTDKELVMTTQEASYATINDIHAKRKKSSKAPTLHREAVRKLEAFAPPLMEDRTLKANNRGGNGRSSRMNGSTNPTTANVTDTEDNADPNLVSQVDGANDALSDDIFLSAPAMDRTANSSIHATRSTRNNQPTFMINGASFLASLGDLAGRSSAVRLLGTHVARERKERNFEEYSRAPPLTDQEQDDDLAMIAAAMKEAEGNPGKMNLKFVEELCLGTTDYTNDGSEGANGIAGSPGSSYFSIGQNLLQCESAQQRQQLMFQTLFPSPREGKYNTTIVIGVPGKRVGQRQYDANPLFPLHHHTQIESHLKPAESLVNEDILDLRSGDKASCRWEKVGGGEGGGLDS